MYLSTATALALASLASLASLAACQPVEEQAPVFGLVAYGRSRGLWLIEAQPIIAIYGSLFTLVPDTFMTSEFAILFRLEGDVLQFNITRDDGTTAVQSIWVNEGTGIIGYNDASDPVPAHGTRNGWKYGYSRLTFGKDEAEPRACPNSFNGGYTIYMSNKKGADPDGNTSCFRISAFHMGRQHFQGIRVFHGQEVNWYQPLHSKS